MSKITFLGTASAVPDRNHQNTHFVVETEDGTILVDCVGNPIVRLQEAGIDPQSVTDLILTHFHPDHISGVPLLLMDLWLMGRKKPLHIYGLESVLDKFEKMMELFEWEEWGGFYPVHLHPVINPDRTSIINRVNLQVQASKVRHMIPAMGVRITVPGGTVCYSTDTGPCVEVLNLAKDADILIHEASGSMGGHTSAREAGVIASDAGVKALVLIHYDPASEPEALRKEAQQSFSGEVIIAKDLMTLPIG